VAASVVYVVRHGESTWNAERRWTGGDDPPLSEVGRAQARAACDALRPLRFEIVASSNLVRASETASILAGSLGLRRLPPDPLFDERFAGPMSGMTASEIEARWPGLLEQWDAGVAIEIPGGEPWPAFVGRVLRGLEALRSKPGRILLVAHMGVQRAIEDGLGRPLGRYGNLEGFWIDGEVRALST
jgi:probable phosphoglycerate mutase